MSKPFSGNPVWRFRLTGYVKFRDYDTGIKGVMEVPSGTQVNIIGCDPPEGSADWDFYHDNGGDGAILYEVPLGYVEHVSGSFGFTEKVEEVV